MQKCDSNSHCKSGYTCQNRQCICTVSSKSPSESTYCTGTKFTQYTNCGVIEAAGTKTCPSGQVCSYNQCICADTYASKGYQCGTWTFCGVSTNCETCPAGQRCDTSIGKCCEDCSPQGKRECITSTTYRMCGSYDPDVCSDWQNFNCAAGKTCVNGYC